METIFDHNPTDEELDLLVSEKTLEEYKKFNTDEDDAYFDIATLYFYREDAKKVKKYVNKISDEMMQQSFWRTFLHP